MKKIIAIVVTLLFSINSFADNGMEQWPALKAMHSVVAATFHPSEEGNLIPVRKKAHELVMKAHELKISSIPKSFDNPKVKHAMILLEKESRALETMVNKKASDAELTKQIKAVHEAFHQIVGLCSKDDSDHE